MIFRLTCLFFFCLSFVPVIRADESALPVQQQGMADAGSPLQQNNGTENVPAAPQQSSPLPPSKGKVPLNITDYPPVPGGYLVPLPRKTKDQERLPAQPAVKDQATTEESIPAVQEKKAARKTFSIQYIVKNKIRYVHLENVADFYQLSMSFPKKKQILLSSKDTKIILYSDQREGKINGIAVNFFEPVLIFNNRMYITENDFLRVIDPALRTKRLQKADVKTIMIDPGHGGTDSGAPGPVLPEKQINLSIARKVAAILKKNGIRVLLTRGGDTFPTLLQRTNMCKKYKPDLYISIHNNASTNTAINGVETYLLTPKGAASSNDNKIQQLSFAANNFDQNNFRLAYEIHGSLLQTTKGIDRGVRHARFFVLKNSSVPAVLLECGYLSNKQEGKKLADEKYQDKIAMAIVTGIFRYIKLTEVKKEK